MTFSEEDLDFLASAGQQLENGSFEDAIKPLRDAAKTGDTDAKRHLDLALLYQQLRDEYSNERLDAFMEIVSLMPSLVPLLSNLVGTNAALMKEFAGILDLVGLDGFARGYRFYRDNTD